MEEQNSKTRYKSKEEKDSLFEKEFMHLIGPLYNFGYRLTLDEDDANDLVQETYLKAYRFFDSYEKGTNAKAWLPGRRARRAPELPGLARRLDSARRADQWRQAEMSSAMNDVLISASYCGGPYHDDRIGKLLRESAFAVRTLDYLFRAGRCRQRSAERKEKSEKGAPLALGLRYMIAFSRGRCAARAVAAHASLLTPWRRSRPCRRRCGHPARRGRRDRRGPRRPSPA